MIHTKMMHYEYKFLNLCNISSNKCRVFIKKCVPISGMMFRLTMMCLKPERNVIESFDYSLVQNVTSQICRPRYFTTEF